MYLVDVLVVDLDAFSSRRPVDVVVVANQEGIGRRKTQWNFIALLYIYSSWHELTRPFLPGTEIPFFGIHSHQFHNQPNRQSKGKSRVQLPASGV